MRNIYLVHTTVNGHFMCSAFLATKKLALKVARRNQAIVSAAPAATFDGGRQYGIDAPTFLAQSDVIADYRVS